jgi:murein tripeptide amidase MpaA
MDYYNVVEVEQAAVNLAAAYPALARSIALPHTTFKSRQSTALHLSTGAGRPAIMFIAGLHGAEWGSCEIALNVAADLLAAYDGQAGLRYGNKDFTGRQIKHLLDQRDIVIFPLVNPDGRHRSQTEPGRGLWRKNVGPGPTRGAEGVDINRNFDFLFNLGSFAPLSGVSASIDPVSECYQGSAPFSEPETQNVRWLLDQFPSTAWFVDIHCVGQVIRYVWTDDDAQDNDPGMNFLNPVHDGKRGAPGTGYGEFLPTADLLDLKALARRFVDDLKAVGGTQYSDGPAFEGVPFSGTSHDYAYSRHLTNPASKKVLSFYVEWGRLDPQPAWSDMETIIKEVSAGLIGFGLATIDGA